MSVFDKLREATQAAADEQDLPDYLARRICMIIEDEQSYRHREAVIAKLAEMVSSYDTYGQTGPAVSGLDNVLNPGNSESS